MEANSGGGGQLAPMMVQSGWHEVEGRWREGEGTWPGTGSGGPYWPYYPPKRLSHVVFLIASTRMYRRARTPASNSATEVRWPLQGRLKVKPLQGCARIYSLSFFPPRLSLQLVFTCTERLWPQRFYPCRLRTLAKTLAQLLALVSCKSPTCLRASVNMPCMPRHL